MKFKIKVNGNPVIILKRLANEKINVLNIKKIKTNLTEIEISKAHKKIFLKQKKYFNAETQKEVPKTNKAFIFACFVFMFVIFMFSCSAFNFKTQINCDDKNVKAEIEEIIKKETGKVIFKKEDIDLNSLKQKIMSLKKVSLASLNYVGLTLVVNVKIANQFARDLSQNIVATCDGMIASINLISGMPNCERGDFVKKGDVLVYAYVITSGQKHYVTAMANINILAYEQFSMIYNENKIVISRTGKKTSVKYFTFFDNKVKIEVEKHSFKLYETESVKQKSVLGGIVPIILISEIVYEVEQLKVFESFEENKNIILEEAILLAKEKAGNHNAFYSENITYRRLTEGVYEVVATVQYGVVI